VLSMPVINKKGIPCLAARYSPMLKSFLVKYKLTYPVISASET